MLFATNSLIDWEVKSVQKVSKACLKVVQSRLTTDVISVYIKSTMTNVVRQGRAFWPERESL